MDDLYFIQSATGYVKIGRAKRPSQRLRDLQTANPHQLELLGTLVGRGYEEKVWHWAFCVERSKGEWFEMSEQLEEAIFLAEGGERWWDHLDPPPNFPLSDDPIERADDIVDWHLGIHLALAAAAEKIGLSGRYAGKALCTQDNGADRFQT